MVAVAHRPSPSGTGPVQELIRYTCETRGKAPAKYAGRKIKCRKCEEPVRIPGERIGRDEESSKRGGPSAAAAARQALGPKTTKPCPVCAEEIQAVAKKCRHCGEMFEESDEPKAAPAGSSHSTLRTIALVFLLCSLTIRVLIALSRS